MKSKIEQFVDLNPWIFEGLDVEYHPECLWACSDRFRVYLEDTMIACPDFDRGDLYILKPNHSVRNASGMVWSDYFVNPAYPTKAEQEMFNMLHPGHRFLFGEGIPEIIYPK